VLSVITAWRFAELFFAFPTLVLAVRIAIPITASILIYLGYTRSVKPGVVGFCATFCVAAFVTTQTHFLLGLPFVWLALLLLATAFGLYLGLRRAGRRPIFQSLAAGAAMFLVTSAAGVAAATLLLLYAVWLSNAMSAAGVGVESIELAGPPYPSTRAPPDAVLKAYQPLFLFSAGEEWGPTPVDAYLTDSRAVVHRPDGTSDPATILLDESASNDDACREELRCYITIQCPSADDACARDVTGERAVYARIIEDPLAAEGLTGASGLVGQVTRLAQYWAFYRYDDWRGWYGAFRQWHEADWEAVTIGLGSRGPLFAAFSSHCGGLWRKWGNRIGGFDARRDSADYLRPLANTPPGHHVLAYVAEGSHGTYPDDFDRAPHWEECADERVPPVFHVATWGPTFGSGVREVMNQVAGDEDDLYGPPLIRVDEATPFLQFKGRWGAADRLDILFHEEQGGGPEAPVRQPVWREPLRTIFCGRYWRPRTECRAISRAPSALVPGTSELGRGRRIQVQGPRPVVTP
jgi:hypothetical protein